jgi:hypothetical protein
VAANDPVEAEVSSDADPASGKDEQQGSRRARGDCCICPAERKTARRHDPPVSLTEVEQQRFPRRLGAGKVRLGAGKDPDPAPSARARGLTGSAPAVREAAADYWTPRRAVRRRAIVRSGASGRALCHLRHEVARYE